MTETEQLLARFFENDLNSEEQAKLLSACQSDANLRRDLIEITRVHRSIRWLHHDEDTQRFESEVIMRLDPDEIESAAFVAGVIAKVHPVPRRKSWFWAAVSAAAAAMALFAMAGWYLKSEQKPNVVPEPHVAVVTSYTGSYDPEFKVGQALSIGALKVRSGSVGLSFAGGALLSVEGPAELMLISSGRARLIQGKASAHVPDGAEGFTIETPGVELVDLGTEFGVSVNAAGEADVHVFTGEVEARLPGDEASPGSLVALNTADSRRFASDGASLGSPIGPNDYPSPPSPGIDAPRTQGAVHFLQQPPLSVETGHLQSNEFILLFKERDSVELTRETIVSFAKPGRYTSAQKNPTKIRPPHQVTSYLLHYDPTLPSISPAKQRREGSVTFSTPVVGVIQKHMALNLTDDLFGHPSAVYDQAKGRGSERKLKDASSDVIVLSRDRRTLHFNLAVSGDLDQIRVLVKTPDSPPLR
jgi:hypothetical protein